MQKVHFAFAFLAASLLIISPHFVFADYHFANYKGRPPIHFYGGVSKTPKGLTPDTVKKAYNLPHTGGHGAIAIIGAYDDENIESDLKVFDSQFGLPVCTIANACFEKHLMAPKTKTNTGWAMETALDVEWAHAIAPQAKILLISAPTPSGKNLVAAVDYAQNRNDVVAISMSWGGAEFPDETALDFHFQRKNGAVFFASSGDNGIGASWPASSPYVVAVGGTHLAFAKDKNNNLSLIKEEAWTGSGGGVSAYESEPAYQKNYSIPRAGGKRSIPDVSYNADPRSGFSIYKSGAGGGWYVVGGTSAGAPQWAAIQSLGLSVANSKIYQDKSSPDSNAYFRDIKSGSIGSCGYYCDARARYDYVTGLGSPLTIHF